MVNTNGIKIANDCDEAQKHAEAIVGMDIRGFTVHEVWVERASRIDAEYYASIILDRSEKAVQAFLSSYNERLRDARGNREAPAHLFPAPSGAGAGAPAAPAAGGQP